MAKLTRALGGWQAKRVRVCDSEAARACSKSALCDGEAAHERGGDGEAPRVRGDDGSPRVSRYMIARPPAPVNVMAVARVREHNGEATRAYERDSEAT